MSYTNAKEKYEKISVNTDKAIEILKSVPVSLIVGRATMFAALTKK